MYRGWFDRLELGHIIIMADSVILEIVSKVSKACLYIVQFTDIKCMYGLVPTLEYFPVNAGKAFPLTIEEENKLRSESFQILYSIILDNQLI